MSTNELEFADEEDSTLEATEIASFSQAVLYSSDWTVETVVSQLVRKNIELNPRFQRRDAWSRKAKSRFIESIILGLPIPQIVLAEKKDSRGQFIVLDGKQRLLTILQFTGNAQGQNNAFSLSGLEARPDLARLRHSQLKARPERVGDLNAFSNHTIRTVVIRNWPNMQFLHLVFLRLNTGTLKLSPQELRQAVVPGSFSNYVDDAALESKEVKTLLGRETPDPRMRDVELIVRYLAFANLVNEYNGRMKGFLDYACQKFNDEWATYEEKIHEDVLNFGKAVEALEGIFGADKIARKAGSRSFNRAIFDALVFYAASTPIRQSMEANPDAIRSAYEFALADVNFAEAVESDTAGIPHTFDRLRLWGEKLRAALGQDFPLPELIAGDGFPRIVHPGF